MASNADYPGYIPVSEQSLTVGELAVDHPRYGELLAVITTRNIVLSLEIVADKEAAKRWFAKESVTQPWIKRS